MATRLSPVGLVAASRWLTQLQTKNVDAAAFVLRSAPEYRDFTPSQYNFAMDWLRQAGLVNDYGQLRNPTPTDLWVDLLSAYLRDDPQPWLQDADELIRSPADLPIEVVEIAGLVGATLSETLAACLDASRKFNGSMREIVGEAGELVLESWLREELHLSVVRVSAFDDSAGFDLLASKDEDAYACVEVKSTVRHDRARIFLSRNEFKRSVDDPNWCLQIVKLSSNHTMDALYWLATSDLAAAAPADTAPGRWETMSFSLSLAAVHVGVAPQIARIA